MRWVQAQWVQAPTADGNESGNSSPGAAQLGLLRTFKKANAELLFPLPDLHQSSGCVPACSGCAVSAPTTFQHFAHHCLPKCTHRQPCALHTMLESGCSLSDIQFVWHLTLALLSAGLLSAYQFRYCTTTSFIPSSSQKAKKRKPREVKTSQPTGRALRNHIC